MSEKKDLGIMMWWEITFWTVQVWVQGPIKGNTTDLSHHLKNLTYNILMNLFPTVMFKQKKLLAIAVGTINKFKVVKLTNTVRHDTV
jgi:hypothetical protein